MPKRPSQTRFHRRLPTYRVKRRRVTANGITVALLSVICPRCDRYHLVNEEAWRNALPQVVTRSCPYCMKVSKIPD